ncbi:MAG: peptidylprolyl isomerase [Saprospiraceae bacterium]|nr:peptidylprolyl isomerase [Saprospiraceae bacterium]
MALIGTIRKNSWLLIVVIGLALAAFVIMDMTGQGGPTAGNLTLVEVDGEKVDFAEMQNSERILYSGGSVDLFSRRNYLYNYYVDRALIGKEAEANGLTVPIPELMDRQFGTNISPLVQARFTDPNTGQVSREQLSGIQQAIQANQLTGQIRDLWAHQEKELISERLTEKLVNMVGKGIYTPTWMVERLNQEQSTRTDFAFVKIPIDEVPESDVAVSDSEIRDYLKNHSSEYERAEESRTIEFASYDVLPTGTDSLNLRDDLATLAAQFRDTENDTIFVENNYGTLDYAYVQKEALSPVIADSIFDRPVGTVYGPYIDPADNSYKAVKLRNRKIIPDSVRCRHILRTVANQVELIAAISKIDSIKELIETGVQTFDSMAVVYSQGSLSVTLNGGDLGWNTNGGYVKPFNDLVFFEAEIGKLYTVGTQFGIHLIEVLESKSDSKTEGVQVAYLNSPIIPSEDTQAEMYDRVLEIVGANRRVEGLRDALQNVDGITLQTSGEFAKNDFTLTALGSGQTSRDIIRWAYEPSTEVGDVSPEVFIYQEPTLYYNNRYVVASLAQINPPGAPVFENVKPAIEGILKAQKRASIVAGEVGSGSLLEIAGRYDTKVDTARGVNFSTDFIAGLGEEPNVAMTANQMILNEVSAPIEGDLGVYVIQPFNRTDPGTTLNIASLRQAFTTQVTNQAKPGVLQSLRKQADINDMRSTYY